MHRDKATSTDHKDENNNISIILQAKPINSIFYPK